MTNYDFPDKQAVYASHRSLVKHEQKLAHRVRNARSRDLRNENCSYLRSYAARYVAALRVVKGRDMARALATKIDLWQFCAEKVTVQAVHKGKPQSYDGCHYRFIYAFGKENVA